MGILMKSMRFFNKTFYFGILLPIIISTACNVIRQSPFSENNKIANGFYHYYFNDSLKIYVQLYGGHKPINPPLTSYNKFTPNTIKTYLKNEFKHNGKHEILFFSYSPWKQFGFQYIGFIHKHIPIHNSYKKLISTNNSIFFEEKEIKKIDSFLLKKYIVPLGQEDLIFYCFKKILYDHNIDSSILESNTHSELMTLKTLSNFEPYHKTKKDFLDSATLVSDLPGYNVPLNELLKLKSENKNNDNLVILNHFLFTAYSFFDEVDTIRQLLFEQHTFKGNNIKNRSSDTVMVNNQLAIPKILEKAGSQKIMMFNESHYDWRNRYFVILMLDSLFKKGYKYLCMEDLNYSDSINERQFPTSKTGYYFKEPFMGSLARTALKIGYKLIAYEDTIDNIDSYSFNSPVDKREYYQALNLYRQYKKDTAAKWIVYAGYSHINKSSFSETEQSTMAKYFYEFSHINPFSINQSTYSDIFSSTVPIDSSTNRENYYYLRNDQINDSALLKQSDFYIINNIDIIPYESLDTSKGFQKYHIRYDKGKSENQKYFIQVFLKDEYFQDRHAIPVYIKRASENIFERNIWLPKNNYYLVVADKNDKSLYESDMSL